MIKFDISNKTCFFRMEVLETLRSVMDPELNVNVVDLGLIYEIDVKENKKEIFIAMTLSSRFCPMGDAILRSVRGCMESYYPQYQTGVSLIWEPEWSYDMITEEGLKELGR